MSSAFDDIFGNNGPDLVYSLPGTDEVRATDASGFAIAPWADGACRIPSLSESTTTPQNYYLHALKELIDELRRDGGKTVIARSICGEFSEADSARMAADYFKALPDTLRFLYRAADGSYWMGATPELLLEDKCEGRCRTRALAGTREAGTAGEWSPKNMAEHAIVVIDMLNRLQQGGLEAIASEPRSLRYGAIEHLCTDIDILNNSGAFHSSIAALLHPTPAVGGYPRERALAHISQIEQTPRGYYAGTLTVPTAAGSLTYVLLRVMHFDRRKWCIYTGSGITADSDPADEWQETQAKAQPLLKATAPYTKIQEKSYE